MPTTFYELHPVSVHPGCPVYREAHEALPRVLRAHRLGDSAVNGWVFRGAWRLPSDLPDARPIVHFEHPGHPEAVDDCATDPARVGRRLRVSIRLGEQPSQATVHAA